VGNFTKIMELLKKEREKQNISLQDLSSRLKIPVFVLKKLEEDEKYVEENYPYSLFMLKSIAKELNISDFNIEDSKENQRENSKQQQPKPKEEKANKKLENNAYKTLKERFLSIFRIIYLMALVISFFALSYSFKKEPEEIVSNYNFSSNNIYKESQNKYLSSPIVLVANNDIWISADIDGKKEVIALKKGQSKVISFKKNIHFETIGNANNLTIIYNGKKVSFSKKIIHNIFVDAEGIFKDGYNLFKGKNG